ncbi:MAG: von Willebrand factor type A domain-containing protein [Alphaproteobacteria bacterium]|nr:von Willebrand factor type A domain-containing protein [Alphaproteobacteria bacterium]
MSDLDNEIQDWYANHEAEPAFLDKLLAMEAEADTAAEPASAERRPANDTRGYRAWLGLGVVGLAAAAALVAVGTAPMLVTGSAEPVPERFSQLSIEEVPGTGATSAPGGDAVADLGFEAWTDVPSTGEKNRGGQQGQGVIAGERLVEPRNPFDSNGDAQGNASNLVPSPGRLQLGGAVDTTTTLPSGGDASGHSYDLDRLVEPTGVSNASSSHPLLDKQVADGKVRRNRGSYGDDDGDWQEALGYAQRAPRNGDGVADVLSQLGYVDADGRFANVLVQGNSGGARGWRPAHTLTTTDALSTFSVDVDTGAWTRSRRAISEGYLPQPGEVRTEELVNAFRYDYEGPTSGPFAASTEVVPSPFDADRHIVRIGVQGKRISVFERKPVHLTFLVDVSGSMQSADRLPLVKQGLKMLVQELRDGDTVAVVTYAGNTRIALEPTSVTERSTILRAIDGLASSGGTAMGAGIDLAYGLASQTLEPGAVNRVVLASDGDANVGETDADRLAQKLRAAADRGITLTTLGFGTGNYRDDVMERLADKGDGHYHYIANEKDARKVLVDGLTGTLQTIARDVKLQVEFDPAVVSEWRQIGYDNRQIADRDFRNDRVDAGEVGAGHQVTALYEVKLVDPSVSSVLGDLRVRYEAPGAEGAPAVERAMKLVGTPRETLREASDDTRVAVVAAAFAERLRMHPGPALSSLDDLLPVRPEYAEDDGELRQAIQGAMRLGLQ